MGDTHESVHIVKHYTPPIELRLTFGLWHREHKDYAKAAEQLQKVFDMDRKDDVFDQSIRRRVIDMLEISYGMGGDAKKAREIYQAAIKSDPQHAMFYYNLACAEAELDNMDGAIENLKLAYKYRDRLPRGQRLPDPRKDDSFQKYMENERFKAELEKMSGAGS